MAKQGKKKENADTKPGKYDLRVVKESPAVTKISKETIHLAVERALIAPPK